MTEAGRSMQDAPVDPPTSPTSEEGMMRRAVSLCCLRLRDASLRLLPPFLTRDSREALQLALDSVELDADDERALGAPSTWVTPKRLRRRWEEGKPFFGQVVRRQQRFAVGVGGVALVLVGTAFVVNWWRSSIVRGSDAALSAGELLTNWLDDQQSERPLEVLHELIHAEHLLRADLQTAEGTPRGHLLGTLATMLEQQSQMLGFIGAEQESVRLWNEAFEIYRQGAALNDPISLLRDGSHRLDSGDIQGAVLALRRAHQLVQGEPRDVVEQFAADYHAALIDLIKLRPTESADLLTEVIQIEKVAFDMHRQGKSAEHFYLIAYNSAVFQILLAKQSGLEANQVLVAVNRLRLALEEAGADQEGIARAILEGDPNLEYLRGHEPFSEVEALARTVLEHHERR